MAFRDLHHFEPGDNIPAQWGNDVNWNIARLARLKSSGEIGEGGTVVDCTPGQFRLPEAGARSAGIELCHGIILEPCNLACSTYRVQRVHRYLRTTCEDCVDGSGSGS